MILAYIFLYPENVPHSIAWIQISQQLVTNISVPEALLQQFAQIVSLPV